MITTRSSRSTASTILVATLSTLSAGNRILEISGSDTPSNIPVSTWYGHINVDTTLDPCAASSTRKDSANPTEANLEE
eukprot:CAMPEP_0174259864 /NCGR_PEP_ID=MMETSP0439-20130205/8639_1 /TAXON_ID=0 /ORGANISM="Stereomyxa ramosa, Strain Chinc5" /LENGTH=77 /DNA_ID=CAMNT_0015343931 /DNA_START=240 /DNA_END=470 /DNA_ORIENTATION=-